MPRYLRTMVETLVLLVVLVAIAYRMRPPVEAPATDAPVALRVAEAEARLASVAERVTAEPRTAVVLGDSSLLDHGTLRPEKTLAVMLEGAGGQAGVPLRVLAAPGFDAVAYYLLADALSARRPGAVVLIANLQTFSDSWFRNLRIKHPDLVAFVRPTRALEAIALPLDEAGVSDASVLTMPLLRRLRVPELPAMLRGYREAFRSRLSGAAAPPLRRQPALAPGAGKRVPPGGGVGRPWPRRAAPPRPGAGRLPKPPPTRTRPRGPATWTSSPFRRTDLYPAALNRDAPAVDVMAAAVRALTARGVRTIVVLAPLHLQALKLTGAYARRDVAGAVAVVRAVSVESGAAVIDLTEALPEETYFSDAYTHFTEEGNRLVTDALIGALASMLAPATSRLDGDP